MQVTYLLEEKEIGPAFLESLKAAFRGKTLKISVEAEGSSTASHEELEQKIADGVRADHAYRLSYDDIAQLADSFEANESVDPVSIFKTHRIDK